MQHVVKLAAAIAFAAAVTGPAAVAQAPAQPGRAVVSLYRAAPGHQVELLKWLAQQDRIAEAAGLPPMQLYAHTDGDSWDYVGINPVTTEAQDKALDAAARKLGLPAGPGVGIELRKHVAVHTDTATMGPMTAAQYLAYIGQ